MTNCICKLIRENLARANALENKIRHLNHELKRSGSEKCGIEIWSGAFNELIYVCEAGLADNTGEIENCGYEKQFTAGELLQMDNLITNLWASV